MEDAHFYWQDTFHWTLVKFRDAVVRWAVAIKRQHAHRAHSRGLRDVDQDTREKYPSLVTIELPDHDFTLTPLFVNTIQRAFDAADAAKAAGHAGPANRRHHPPAARPQHGHPPAGARPQAAQQPGSSAHHAQQRG